MNYKLNLESINKLRKIILKELENVPDGEKIKLDTEVLDDLIFFKYINKTTKEQNKMPIWTGPFLRKLDLSKLTFKDSVLVGYDKFLKNNEIITKTLYTRNEWDYSYGMNEETIRTYNEEYKKCNDEILVNSRYTFDFSYTNIKPDFSKLKEGSCNLSKTIDGCNFEGVDLSKSKYEKIEIHNCNMKNTKIKYTDALWEDSDFSDNDFSNTVLNLDSKWLTRPNNFSNTGLKIKYKFNINPESKKSYDLLNRYNLIENNYPVEQGNLYKKYTANSKRHGLEIMKHHIFIEVFKKGYFNGCFINNKFVNNNNAKTTEKSYEEFEQELVNSIYQTIEKQKQKIKK